MDIMIRDPEEMNRPENRQLIQDLQKMDKTELIDHIYDYIQDPIKQEFFIKQAQAQGTSPEEIEEYMRRLRAMTREEFRAMVEKSMPFGGLPSEANLDMATMFVIPQILSPQV